MPCRPRDLLAAAVDQGRIRFRSSAGPAAVGAQKPLSWGGGWGRGGGTGAGAAAERGGRRTRRRPEANTAAAEGEHGGGGRRKAGGRRPWAVSIHYILEDGGRELSIHYRLKDRGHGPCPVCNRRCKPWPQCRHADPSRPCASALRSRCLLLLCRVTRTETRGRVALHWQHHGDRWWRSRRRQTRTCLIRHAATDTEPGKSCPPEAPQED